MCLTFPSLLGALSKFLSFPHMYSFEKNPTPNTKLPELAFSTFFQWLAENRPLLLHLLLYLLLWGCLVSLC